MKVETYECEETATEHVECSDEAIRLIEEMGLSGQQEFLAPKENKHQRVPYRKIMADEAFVFRQICPKDVELSAYSDGPIPLRVLQVASHAKSLGVFTSIRVWCRESATIKDPVLLGYIGDYYSPKEIFILARWGEALDEMPALVKTALSIWKERIASKLRDVVREASTELATIENATITDAMKHRNDPTFYF